MTNRISVLTHKSLLVKALIIVIWLQVAGYVFAQSVQSQVIVKGRYSWMNVTYLEPWGPDSGASMDLSLPAIYLNPKLEAVPSSKETLSSPKTCKPVKIATGEKILEQQDFQDESLLPLSLTRIYRNQNGGSTMFGPGWRSSLEWGPLQLGGNMTTVEFPDGQRLQYEYGRPQSQLTGYAVERIDPNVGVFHDYYLKNRVYVFNTQNYITSISQNGVMEYQFTYVPGAMGRLQKVTNAYGRSVTFNWGFAGANNSWRVISIIAADGMTWTYGYNSKAMLETVTPQSGINGSAGIYTYFYEMPNASWNLTGYAIDGVRRTTYAYDPTATVTWNPYGGAIVATNLVVASRTIG